MPEVKKLKVTNIAVQLKINISPKAFEVPGLFVEMCNTIDKRTEFISP